jgi:hypothetical protein
MANARVQGAGTASAAPPLRLPWNAMLCGIHFDPPLTVRSSSELLTLCIRASRLCVVQSALRGSSTLIPKTFDPAVCYLLHWPPHTPT